MNRPFVLGLTGSVGMGKSTTANMFRDAGIPVWDADATVHQLYSAGGAAVESLADLAPESIRDGAVDRLALRTWVAADPTRLDVLEQVVHPLVAADRSRFLQDQTTAGQPLVVLDIPLLFETGADSLTDATLVVTAPPAVQRARVLARAGMTEAAFDTILKRQMPDAQKRSRATYVITTETLDGTRRDVLRLIAQLQARLPAKISKPDGFSSNA